MRIRRVLRPRPNPKVVIRKTAEELLRIDDDVARREFADRAAAEHWRRHLLAVRCPTGKTLSSHGHRRISVASGCLRSSSSCDNSWLLGQSQI
jgi:hypothetical protein